MNTMTEASKVRTTSDRSLRAVADLTPGDMRDFLLDVAFLTLGACHDEATIDSGASISLDRETGMLLSKHRVEGMSGYRGFNDGARQKVLSLLSDDETADWRLVDENALRQANTTYRPDPGVWMSFEYLPVKGVWRVDMQLMSQCVPGTPEARASHIMRVGPPRDTVHQKARSTGTGLCHILK